MGFLSNRVFRTSGTQILIHTLSKKHCGRKDNLGRVLANCNFSEPKAGTVSAFISMGLLDKLVMFDLHVIA